MDIGFTNVGLSSMLSNHIVIDTEGDTGTPEITVYVNNKLLYQTELYALENKVHLYDLGMLVNDYMRSNVIAKCTLSVAATFENHIDSVSVVVVYAAIGTSYEFGSDFLFKHFLTTRSSFVVPRDRHIQVAFFCEENDQSPEGCYDLSIRLTDGSHHSVRIPHILNDTRENRIYYFDIVAAELDSQVQAEFPDDTPVVLGGAVIHGQRKLNFYFVDEEPIDMFYFANAFNVNEYYHVYGVTNIKTDFTQKEAVSSGVSTYYGQSSEQWVQVETAPLTIEEAEWLNQFLGSPHIMKEISEDMDGLVLLSDISSEVSSSPKEQNSMKFSWKFADNLVRKIYNPSYTRFANKFNETYH